MQILTDPFYSLIARDLHHSYSCLPHYLTQLRINSWNQYKITLKMYQISLLLFKACQYSQRRVLYLLLNWVGHPSTWLKYTEIRILITNSFIIVVELQTIPLWWPVLSELFSLSLRFQTEFITEPPVINLRPTTFYFSRYPFQFQCFITNRIPK